MIKKPFLSIGIPAYNEQANIKNLLTSLLAQAADDFELKEILVVSDGSTDKTDDTVTSFNTKQVRLLADGQRKGKPTRLNEILKAFNGDILIILDADILPDGPLFLNNLIQPILKDKNVGLVGAKVVPLPGRSYFEKIINFSHSLKYEIYESLRNMDNVYLCHGRARAFSRKLAQNLIFTKFTPEDAYSYFYCQKLGLKFVYEPNAKVLFRSPQFLEDHLKQSLRFNRERRELEKFFSAQSINKNYAIPKRILISKFLKNTVTHPILLSSYVCVVGYTSLVDKINNKQAAAWDIAASSKQL